MSNARQDIVDALVTRLKTITTGNGYSSNAGNAVYSWYPENLQVATVPMLSVNDTGDSIQDLSGSRTQHRLTFDVVGICSNTTTTDEAARSMIADIAKCLMNPVDRTLSGKCDSLSLTDGGSIQLEQTTDVTRASVRMSLTVDYVTERGDWSVNV